MDNNTLRDRIRGSLIGGAIDDALGYPVEFSSRQSILAQYGKNGITKFDLSSGGKALISDDTQMTLFTANGLLYGITRWCTHGMLADLPAYVNEAYKEWYQTQTGKVNYQKRQTCWIRDIEKLNHKRAPGNTCMSALANPQSTNNSKGCGGIMRVAPVAMLIASEISRGITPWKESDVVRLASECAKITHKHPMGYICAAVFGDILFQIYNYESTITEKLLLKFIETALANAHAYCKDEGEFEECGNLRLQINNAIELSKSSMPDHEAISQLGEGWTGDETLTIALFCTLRHINDFHAALVAAVNHDGDSDSTGSVCGNLMGSIVGEEVYSFPDMDKLELKSLLLEIANDIIKGCTISEYHWPSNEEEKRWEKRYVYGEDYLTPFDMYIRHRLPHIMLPKAVRMKNAYRLVTRIDEQHDIFEKCLIAYDMSLVIFDGCDFNPQSALEYGGVKNDEPDFYQYCKDILPAYYWGYEDPMYSPENSNRVFKLNVKCFRGKSPIIAVRDNCGCQKIDLSESFAYKLRAGLEPIIDMKLQEQYPEWLFLRINYSTADNEGFAVFTNQLEKEFSVEVAHLGTDGKLHRIYVLNY